MPRPRSNSPEGKSRELIDKMLEKSGWTLLPENSKVPESGCFAVDEVQTESGPMDYALYVDGILIGDVEAKSEEKGVPAILEQDERYSKTYSQGKYDFNGYHIPFLYSSNGHLIWFKDVRSKNNIPREISNFHTPDALTDYLTHDIEEAYDWLQGNPIELEGLRPYQIEAVEAIEGALFSNKRKMLLAMATGTGKTRVAAMIIYRLLRSGAAKRILFLVDRRSLAAQAVSSFASFEPEPAQKLDKLYEVYHQKFRKEDLGDDKFNPSELPPEYLKEPKSNHTYVFISTIQRMQMKLFGRKGMFPWTEEDYYEDDDGIEDIPINTFDVIIADESHRGYTSAEDSKWREVLEHFDAIKIGLTATPAKHTTAYFKDIVYHYPVERAVQEGYLVDWDYVRIDSGIRMDGLFLKEGEEVKYIDPHTGEKKYEHLEDEREFPTTALERSATAPDTNKKIIKEFAKYAREFEKENGRFPKTLVFATNDIPHVSHCDRIVEWFQNEFSDKGGGFVKKITGTVDRPLQQIRYFRNRPTEPAIVVTVDMLSTGVDIPTLEAIIFIRPVKSRILFEQMMGRGTRLSPDIGKDHFTIYDAVGVVDYFKNATNFPDPLPTKKTKSYKEIIEELANNKNRDYNVKILTRRLLRISKNISAHGREELNPLIGQDIAKFAESFPEKFTNDFEGTMKILKNESLIYKLEHYEKIKADFLVAESQIDEVSSEYFPIVVNGIEYKPADYLLMFKEFLRKEPDTIEALSILLKRPKDLNTDLLDDLRTKLASRPEQFTIKNLRRAYGNNLADIIGIVKAALTEQTPISTEGKVGLAMESITEGKNLSEDEKIWLHWIANHLVSNLLIEKRHFNSIPFSTKGGWKEADKDFDGKLEEIIMKLNTVMTS
jgi:type I restriction enzyme, R subunit